ncbi:MAG: hypothetical protein A2X55_07780 [Nitrospirae bacterium GWB2_47_37]|nr:MAG: hypothetical protein A2X55_07780 [Nitrospirae bacterium GWB2_47_37]
MGNLFGGSKSETTVTTPQNTTVNPTTNVYVGNEALNLDPIYRVVEAITTQDLEQFKSVSSALDKVVGIAGSQIEAQKEAAEADKEQDKKMFILTAIAVGFMGVALARK